MRKRVITIVLTLIMIIGVSPIATFASLPCKARLIVSASEEARLDSDVIVDLSKSGKIYKGVLYLPGNVDTSKLCFSWDDNIELLNYNNGEAPIAERGQTAVYSASIGGKSTTLKIKTVQGSAEIKSMFINIDESYGDGSHTINAMNADSNHEVSCYGTFAFDGKSKDLSIKGRGNSTWNNILGLKEIEKKPYNITVYKNEDLEKDRQRYSEKDGVKLIGDVKAKKWTLLANYMDGTLLHNKIGYDLACDLDIGLKSEYVDIWMNGKYLGNYLMTPKNDYGAPDGGYVLEIDNNCDKEDPYFRLNGLKRKPFVENVITVKDVGDDAVDAGIETRDIQEWLQTVFNAIRDYDSDEYIKYVDVDSWAKLYLIHELNKTFDTICGSILMHRDGLTEDDKLIAGPAWDMDLAFGRTVPNPACGIGITKQLSTEGWYIDGIKGYTSFLQCLGKHQSFMKRVYEMYNEYKWAFDRIPSNIEIQIKLLTDSANMNYTKFNVNQMYSGNKSIAKVTYGHGKYRYNQIITNSWEDYLTNFKGYVNGRLAYLSDKLYAQTPTGYIKGRTQMIIGEEMTLKAVVNRAGECSYQWQASSDGITWENINGATGKIFSTKITADMEGMSYRCVVDNAPIICTKRVAKASIPSAKATLEPVSVSLDGQKHRKGIISIILDEFWKLFS